MGVVGMVGGGRVDQVSDDEGEVYDVLVGHNTWDDYQVLPIHTYPRNTLDTPMETLIHTHMTPPIYTFTTSLHPISSFLHPAEHGAAYLQKILSTAYHRLRGTKIGTKFQLTITSTHNDVFERG